MKAAEIRKILAREFNLPESYEFFHMDKREGETTDQMLERLFEDEKQMHLLRGNDDASDEDIVLVLAHG
jgi:hypothetical protein